MPCIGREPLHVIDVRKRRIDRFDPGRPAGIEQPSPGIGDLAAFPAAQGLQIGGIILRPQHQRLDPRNAGDSIGIFQPPCRFDQGHESDRPLLQTVLPFKLPDPAAEKIHLFRVSRFGGHDIIRLQRHDRLQIFRAVRSIQGIDADDQDTVPVLHGADRMPDQQPGGILPVRGYGVLQIQDDAVRPVDIGILQHGRAVAGNKKKRTQHMMFLLIRIKKS